MPLINACDNDGCYYKFGDHGHKYYYDPHLEIEKYSAREKALRQGRAIQLSKHRNTRKRGGILNMYMMTVN